MTTSPESEASNPTKRRRTGVTPWSALVPVVGIVAGSLFASSSAVSGDTGRTGETSLTDLIARETRENSALDRQLNDLETRVDSRQDAAGEDSGAISLRAQIGAASQGVGRSALRGPALTVSLDDSPLRGDQIPEQFNVNDVVVHQQDVQAVVNALWAGGADAMMLMDQRVINTSAVRCVGSTLILQGQVYSPPFTISAIGDIDQMRASLDSDPNVSVYREYVDALGLVYDVTTEPEVTFPAYEGSTTLKYAKECELRGCDT